MAKEPAHKLASGDTAYLYRAAIGPRGQDYYLRHFARFDGEGRTGSSWNWAAYWSTFNWLLYRRMWGQALFYVGALLASAFLIFGLGKLIFNYSDTTALLLFLLLLTVAFVLPGLYANAWFYTHCNEKITKALSQTPEVRDAATALASQAPGQRRLLWLGLGNALTLGLLVAVLAVFQSSESALGQLAARPDRAPASSPAVSTAPVRALDAAPSVAQAAPPAPDAARAAAAAAPVASAPQLSPTPAPATAAPAVAAPAVAQAASNPGASDTRPVVAAGNPDLRKASDRSPAAARPAEPATTATAPPAAARAPAAPPRATPASAPALQRYVWVIQVGAYAQEANAQKALDQVQGLGLDAGAESFETAQGKLMRVRVGPFMRQAEADQAALRIKSLELPALVLRQRP